jgi:hypothetical protein
MFNELREALLRVEPKVGHYRGFKNEDKYIVWAEDNQGNSVWADGKMQNQVIEGTIDYFLKDEDDMAILRMQAELDKADISYRYNSTQYEDDTGFIHHEWIFQLAVM